VVGNLVGCCDLHH